MQACFNPRPALGPGATRRLALPRPTPICFNPRPALGPGATISRVFRIHRPCVSILARLWGRALLRAVRVLKGAIPGFNPRPALGPGATRELAGARRPCLRCFNPRPALGPGATRRRPRSWRSGQSFNPRPALGPGATAKRLLQTGFLCCFNPRPALGPGATRLALRGRATLESFNPRPALGPGATYLPRCQHGRRLVVSILARLWGRALPLRQ